MRKELLAATAIIGSALGGCVPVPYAYQVMSCKVDGFPALVGRETSEATGKEILRVSGAKILRWAPPGTMVTMDYNPERVTAWTGPDNKITRLTCG